VKLMTMFSFNLQMFISICKYLLQLQHVELSRATIRWAAVGQKVQGHFLVPVRGDTPTLYQKWD